MIDYSPLHNTLEEKGMKISDLRGVVLNSRTIASINKNYSVQLRTIEKICQHLNVGIQDVVRIK